MAKISTYPIVSIPTLNDLLIGTDVENLNETKNFSLADIQSLIVGNVYVPYTGATQGVDLGVYGITASYFTVPGGLSTEFLKADGSLDSTVYQPAGNYITGLTGQATASGPGVATVTLNNGAVIGKVLTGLTITGGSISSTDSILQAFGKLQNQVNSLYGGAIYQGTWNANTNTPALASGVGTQGWYYIVNVAGSTNLDGITDWNVGDWAIFDGTAWQQVDNTDTVVSVNGQVGVVVLTTTNIAEGTNLYYLDSRARQAISLTTTGSSGASTYDNLTGILNVPNYTLSGLGGVPSTRQLTINGTAYDLSADRSWSVGTVTSVGTSAPLTGGTITGSGTIGITQSGVASDGYLSSTDWNTFNNKQNALTNPVTGTGTVYYLPMWTGVSALSDSIISYASNAVTFNYNSASGGTVNYTNTGGTTYTYTIQMNNIGSPRQTYHSYTDGNVLQQINGNVVSSNLQSGQLVLPYYTTTSSFTGTQVGYLGFDASGNILSVAIPSLTGYVPYTGATGNVDLGEYGISGGYFQADLTPTQAGGVGRLIWNSDDGTLDLGLMGGNVTLQIGQEQVARVVNGTGANLLESEYKAVKIIGAQGQRLQVGLARADNDFNSKDSLGIVTEDINNNQEGFITTSGLVRKINTTGSLQGETWSDGDTLYLSGTTFGALTNVKPIAPIHTVIIGFVVYAHANNGKIYVKVDNGYELEELHDVAPTPYVNNGVLYRDTTLNLWKSATIPTVLGYTPADAATTLTINGTSYDLSANRTWSVGTVTSVSALTIGTTGTDITSTVATGTTTPVITLNVPTASATSRGALSSTDWSTFNSKQDAITLTTTGTSGAATLVGSTLNIPQYSGGGGMAIGGSITGATAGSVLFAGTSGVLAQDNGNFFWDDSNNRLGIGTATPSNQLQVYTTSTSNRGIIVTQASNDVTASLFTGSKIRGAGAVINGDILFNFNGQGYDGSAYQVGSAIRWVVDGVVSAGSVPTSVEFRTGSSALGTARLTISSAGVSTFSGQVISTSAGSTTTGGGQLYLNGATGNRIDFNTNGVAAPAFTTRSAGTKIVLYPQVAAALVDYAIGIESGTIWQSIPEASVTYQYKWYAGTTSIMSLSGTGQFIVSRDQNLGTRIQVSNTTSGTASEAFINCISSGGNFSIGKFSATTTTSKIRAANDAYIYNSSAVGDIAILNDFASGVIKFAAGGSSTAQAVIKTTGQLQLNNYTSTSSFTGTAAGYLAFDSSGNILTAPTPSGGASIGGTVTGGTAGSILFIDPTATLAEDNSNLFWDNSNNRLGIGTATPTTSLDVTGTGRFTSDLDVNGVLKQTVTTNRQTASYTLALTDRGKLVEMNVATANNLTVPLNSVVAFPVGTQIDIVQYGAGQTTVVATGGVTIRSTNSWLKINARYGAASLIKIATDEWYLIGNINA